MRFRFCMIFFFFLKKEVQTTTKIDSLPTSVTQRTIYRDDHKATSVMVIIDVVSAGNISILIFKMNMHIYMGNAIAKASNASSDGTVCYKSSTLL